MGLGTGGRHNSETGALFAEPASAGGVAFRVSLFVQRPDGATAFVLAMNPHDATEYECLETFKVHARDSYAFRIGITKKSVAPPALSTWKCAMHLFTAYESPATQPLDLHFGEILGLTLKVCNASENRRAPDPGCILSRLVALEWR